MLADYFLLGLVATVCIGGGVFLLGKARGYRACHDVSRNGVQAPVADLASVGAPGAFAAHEILDRTYCVASILELLLLDRQDLPESIREQLDQASGALWRAYQAMGQLSCDTDANRGELK